MSTLLRGRVVTAEADLPDAVVELADGRVADVRAPRAGDPASADVVVLPGLVDLHCHGGGGASFTTGDRAQVEAAARHHLAQGTTTLLGSTVTDSPERLLAAVATLADGVEAGLLAGIHAEGPFLSAARCGAQDPAWLRAPDLTLTAELVAAGRGHLRVMTVAPELPGADALAELLLAHDVVAAAGHTEADAATLRRFVGRRAPRPGLVTHLCNGMPPLHHRDPGPVLGALSAAAAGEAVVELIGDGVHLADETVAGVLDLVGAGSVVLVTDAMAAAGMPDGRYVLGPQEVEVVDGTARLVTPDGSPGAIAGGTARLLDVVRRQVHAGLAPSAAVGAATAVPARVLGLADRGHLAPGARADVLVLDPAWRPVRVLQAGRDVPDAAGLPAAR